MYKNKTFLAIIPARGGSKRLPRKNILSLAGKPLIAWSIEAALATKYIDDVIVTSDDDEILSIAQKFGANIIKRSPELSSDTATTFDAIQHTILKSKSYDYVVLLQPTSPLRKSKHIKEAIELLDSKNADAIIAVTKTEHSPRWMNILPHDKDMSKFLSTEISCLRSQDLETYYQLNGSISITKTTSLLEAKTFFLKNNIFAYPMNRESSIDIDEPIDLMLANCLMKISEDEIKGFKK